VNKLSFTRVERKFEAHVPVLHSARPVLEEEGNERPQAHVESSTIPKNFPDRQSALIHFFMVDNEFHIQYLSLLFVLGKRGYNPFFSHRSCHWCGSHVPWRFEFFALVRVSLIVALSSYALIGE
jgi:hypothetical protein